MGHRHADVAQHGRVGQIALEARDGQLRGEVLENGVGDAEVALGVLEVDGVDLVGHGARSDLPGLDLLFEVLHQNVGPHVPREVDEDGVDALHVVEDRREVVVMLDLGRILRTLQPQAVVHKSIGKSHPIHRRISYVMRVEIARRTAELGRHGQRAQLRQLLLKPLDEALLHEVGLNFQHVVTIEDGVKKGGMGSAILEFMADNDYIPHFRRIGVPDAFIEHGTIQELHHLCGMDEEGIYNQLIIDS